MKILKIRWKALAILVAVVVMSVVAACLFLSKMQERKEYVGKSDFQSGYRCRFTLSTTWKHKDDWVNPGTTEGTTFVSSPSAIRRWVETYLFRRRTTPPNPPTIMLMCVESNALKSTLMVQAGYPEVTPSPASSLRVYTHRHLWIDGCPATVITGSDKPLFGTILLVYVPNKSIAYVMVGYSVSAQNAGIDDEMQAIIASFHVEKAAAPDRVQR